MTDPRKSIPRTDHLLAAPAMVAAAVRLGERRVRTVVAGAQDAARRGELAPGEVATTVERELAAATP
ncbi:L-seryl-tRNA(Sec) selenium transferase, partial [Tsukamurella columbiensis]|nr:L-seryl-tRNA(Sec) selenium transferase [Tsukamurella columbiensis]